MFVVNVFVALVLTGLLIVYWKDVKEAVSTGHPARWAHCPLQTRISSSGAGKSLPSCKEFRLTRTVRLT
jgi:hypothetical protein